MWSEERAHTNSTSSRKTLETFPKPSVKERRTPRVRTLVKKRRDKLMRSMKESMRRNKKRRESALFFRPSSMKLVTLSMSPLFKIQMRTTMRLSALGERLEKSRSTKLLDT
jgi:hypothetical protein